MLLPLLQQVGMLGAVTHDASGTLTGQTGSIVGSANRAYVRSTSGSLTGQLGSIVGSANHLGISADLSWSEEDDVYQIVGTVDITPQSNGAGGEYIPTYRYFAYDYRENLEEARSKSEHAAEVLRAAEEAAEVERLTKLAQDARAIEVLRELAIRLQFKIAENDTLLLQLELARLRYERNIDDEEALLMLL